MKPTYQQNEPLEYFTYRIKDDSTVRFTFATKAEIAELKKNGAIEVEIGTFKGKVDE